MKIRKNYANVWLSGERMEKFFPQMVQEFTGRQHSYDRVTKQEDETIINVTGSELRNVDIITDEELETPNGFVSFYTTETCDIAKILHRASKAIFRMKMDTSDGEVNGVEFIIDKDAFRGATSCFNTKFKPDTPFLTGREGQISEEAKVKMQKARKNGKKK